MKDEVSIHIHSPSHIIFSLFWVSYEKTQTYTLFLIKFSHAITDILLMRTLNLVLSFSLSISYLISSIIYKEKKKLYTYLKKRKKKSLLTPHLSFVCRITNLFMCDALFHYYSLYLNLLLFIIYFYICFLSVFLGIGGLFVTYYLANSDFSRLHLRPLLCLLAAKFLYI